MVVDWLEGWVQISDQDMGWLGGWGWGVMAIVSYWIASTMRRLAHLSREKTTPNSPMDAAYLPSSEILAILEDSSGLCTSVWTHVS